MTRNGSAPRRDRVGKRVVDRIERDVLPAGEEADEVTTLRRPVTSDRPPQNRVRRLERVEDRALGRALLGVEAHLAVNAGQRSKMLRKGDANHGNVWASTESTAGRSRTIGVQLSPESGDA